MKKLRFISLLMSFLLLMASTCMAGSVIFNKDTLYRTRHVIIVSLTGASDSVTLSTTDLKDCMGMLLFSAERVPTGLSTTYALTISGASGYSILSNSSCSQTATQVTDYINYPVREPITITETGVSAGSVSVVLTFTN